MANFSIDYTNANEYQFDSDKIEIDSGLAKLKDITPIDSSFSANYDIDINGSWGDGILTASPSGSISVVGGKLDLTGYYYRWLDYDATLNADSQQTGCIRFKVTPNYTGTPSKYQAFFSISRGTTDIRNLITLFHSSNGYFYLYITDLNGSQIYNHNLSPQWQPVSGTEYEFEFNWDLTAGSSKLFIDGIQFGILIPNTGVRDSNITLLRIGAPHTPSTTWKPNFYLDDLIIFSQVQHTSNYTPGYNVNKYDNSKPTIYKTLGDSVANIEEWINFIETLGVGNEGLVRYQLSEDALSWKYWNGSIWDIAGASDYNTSSIVNTNINDFPSVADKIFVKAFLISNGTQKIELDLNTIGYVINTVPLVYAGTDKDVTVNVLMKPFGDAIISDSEGNIVKAEWKEDGGVYAEIPQGAYSTLLEAVQNFDYTPITAGDMNLFLKITDSFDASSEDNLSLHTTHVVIDVTIKDVNGNHLSNVTFDPGYGAGSSIKDSPFSLTAHIGTYTSVLSKTYFDTLSETNTISISTTELNYIMERETRIDELVCQIDAPRTFTKGDTLSFNGVIDINLTNYKIRCDISDADNNKIKLATSNSGGSDSEINIFNSASGNFIINVSKDLTTLFADIVYIEIEIENTSGQIRTVFKERVKFEDQNLTWTEPS